MEERDGFLLPKAHSSADRVRIRRRCWADCLLDCSPMETNMLGKASVGYTKNDSSNGVGQPSG